MTMEELIHGKAGEIATVNVRNGFSKEYLIKAECNSNPRITILIKKI